MGKKVLVADDEAHILHVVTMKLSNAGYEVITAVDGEEALELCKAERPDIVITDYQMPIMSGLQFCTALREDESVKDIPAIMLTARGFDIEQSDPTNPGMRYGIYHTGSANLADNDARVMGFYSQFMR